MVLFTSASVTLLICATYVSSSVIVLHSNPTTVIEGLTDEATIRCFLNDTAASSASVIGRRRRDVISSRDVTSKRDITSTASNVEQVSSIIIMKDGVDLASITQSHPATSHVNATNMKVTGDVSGKRGVRGFLELSLAYPTPAQIGEYSCEVSAVTQVGHTVIFGSNLEINKTVATSADLVNEIKNQKQHENQLEHNITTQQQAIADLNNQITKLNSKLNDSRQQDVRIKLIGGDTKTYGGVEVEYNGQTGFVCSHGFTAYGAQVVCHMLGFSLGKLMPPYNLQNTTFLVDLVQCNGKENSLEFCGHTPWGTVDTRYCTSAAVAGVQCS